MTSVLLPAVGRSGRFAALQQRGRSLWNHCSGLPQQQVSGPTRTWLISGSWFHIVVLVVLKCIHLLLIEIGPCDATFFFFFNSSSSSPELLQLDSMAL